MHSCPSLVRIMNIIPANPEILLVLQSLNFICFQWNCSLTISTDSGCTGMLTDVNLCSCKNMTRVFLQKKHCLLGKLPRVVKCCYVSSWCSWKLLLHVLYLPDLLYWNSTESSSERKVDWFVPLIVIFNQALCSRLSDLLLLFFSSYTGQEASVWMCRSL